MPIVIIEVNPAPVGVKCSTNEISGVVKNSQAEKAGVQIGWKCIEIAGKKMSTGKEISKALADGKKNGKKYSIKFETPDTGASSVKELTEEGAKVTTIATTTNNPTAPAPTEPTAEELAKKEEEEKKLAEEKLKAEEEEAKRIAEEEEKKKLEAEQEAERIRLEEERKAKSNGKCVMKYEMYNEEFEIKDGSTTMEAIDDEYAFTFVMPNCKVHLSEMEPGEIVRTLAEGPERYMAYMPEEPVGTYQKLEAGKTYYCIVIEDTKQAQKDREEYAKKYGHMAKVNHDPAARTQETCSCVEGNPCVDEYICKNWHTRFAVAKSNGWKGF